MQKIQDDFWEKWEKDSPFREMSRDFKKISTVFTERSKKKKKEEREMLTLHQVDPSAAMFIGYYLGTFYRQKYFWNKRTRKLYIRSALDPNNWILIASLKSPPLIWEELGKIVKGLREKSVEKFKGWYKSGN